jgi:hypothetical protein
MEYCYCERQIKVLDVLKVAVQKKQHFLFILKILGSILGYERIYSNRCS